MARAVRAYVLLDGQPMPSELVVSSIEFTEEIVGAPAPASEITLKIANPGYRYSDAIALLPGKTVDVLVSLDGERTSATHLARGVIVKAEPLFVGTGTAPDVVVRARDASAGARVGDTEKGWTSQSDANKARAVARAMGWATTWRGASTIGKAGGQRADSQSAPDMRFLGELAQRYSYDCSVRWDDDTSRWVLWWGPPQEDRSRVLDLRHNYPGYDETLAVLDFAPIIAGAGQQVSGMQLAGFDVTTEQVATGNYREVSTYDRELRRRTTEVVEVKREQTTGARVRFTVFGEAVMVRTDQPIKTRAQATEFARQFMRAHRDRWIAGRGKVPGDPRIRAGQIHRLGFYASESTGPRELGLYSGEYLLSSTRHLITAGAPYVVEFGARKKGPR